MYATSKCFKIYIIYTKCVLYVHMYVSLHCMPYDVFFLVGDRRAATTAYREGGGTSSERQDSS